MSKVISGPGDSSRQTITWTKAEYLSPKTRFGNSFSEVLIKISTELCSIKKIHVKMTSAKLGPVLQRHLDRYSCLLDIDAMVFAIWLCSVLRCQARMVSNELNLIFITCDVKTSVSLSWVVHAAMAVYMCIYILIMFVYRQLSRMLLRPALWEDAFKSIIFSKYLYTWVYETYVTLCIIAGIINYNFDWIQYLPILIGHIGAIYTFCRQCLRQQWYMCIHI